MTIIVGATAFVIAGFAYVGVRLLRPFELGRRASIVKWAVLSALLICVLSYPVTFVVPQLSPEGARFDWIHYWAAFGSMGLSLILGMFVFIRDLAWACLWIVARIRRSWSGSRDATSGERRHFIKQLSSGATLVAAGSFGVGGLYSARALPTVVPVDVPIRGLRPSLRGFTIAQISDLHVGNTVGRAFVEKVVELVNDLDADVVAITGDLTDGVVRDLGGRIAPLGELSARHGVFFVTGNHDYYSGDAEGWVSEIARLGITPLMNEHRVVSHRGQRIVIAGVTDYRAGDFVASHRTDPDRALRGAPLDVPTVLLAHQPRTLFAASRLNVSLQLSGHTHGGQIFPFHLAALITQPFLAGLNRLDDTWVYVSRGTGYWGPPFRVFAPSEVALLTLNEASRH